MENPSMSIGQRVRMTWAGGSQVGTVAGPPFRLTWIGGSRRAEAVDQPFYRGQLPSGVYVPVEWPDGTRDDVDLRVLSVIPPKGD